MGDGVPCQNGGTCVDELGGYLCKCTANFTGTNCTDPGDAY